MKDSTKVRLDKWLWAARFYKTRGLAADAVDGGKVHVNGERAKRAKLVQVGDEIRVRNGPFESIIHVTGISERRGSAAIAAELYTETAESREARERVAAHVKAMQVSGHFESGRPTKRDRRQIEAFRRRES
jgi:ribosome-associated heat shock protein Hsp15